MTAAPTSPATLQVAQPSELRERVARIVKGARLSAAFGREFRAGDGRLDDVDCDAADAILALSPNGREIVEACTGIADDYMTSDKHHPGYVLIPTEKFERIAGAVAGLIATSAVDGREIVRERLRVMMLAQPTTGLRETYSDGFAQGLACAIQALDSLSSGDT